MSVSSNPVNWFEIPASDLKRAKAFYETVLGVDLELNRMGPLHMAWFPMAQNAPGAAGTLAQMEGYTPSHEGTLVYFSVQDIASTLGLAERHGGKTLMPKMPIGQHGHIAHFEDSEGNRLGIHMYP
jgi:predicted enzyme related to lactoylglutathione lyase